MKVFICHYNKFSLAIPADFISSIFIQSFKVSNQVQYNSKNRITYVSLPMLFNCPNVNIKHGIILKKNGDFAVENKIILLSAKIENEKDIPDEYFYPLPKIMNIMKISDVFNGIFFNAAHNASSIVESAKEVVLLLNTERLMQNIQKEINK